MDDYLNKVITKYAVELSKVTTRCLNIEVQYEQAVEKAASENSELLNEKTLMENFIDFMDLKDEFEEFKKPESEKDDEEKEGD